MHEKFEKYLNEIGEIPHDIELDLENPRLRWRYLAPAYIRKDSNGEIYHAYGSFGGEVLIVPQNGENEKVIGWFKINKMSDCPEEENWFYNKYIINPYCENKKTIKRIWGVTNYIWGRD